MADAWDQFSDPKPAAGDPWAAFSDPHPSMGWDDVAVQAVQNIPSSAYNMGASIANTVMHPIDTAQGLYDVGKGAVSKAAGVLGVEQDPETKAQNEAAIDAVGQFFADRYGGMENFKKTIATDPVGFAMDLSTILSGGGAALARVPGATRAANAVGKAAELTNPVALPGKVATGVAEPLASNVIGIATGVGDGPIRQAARAGLEGNKTFVDNMRGNVPMTDVIDQAQSAVGQMRQDRAAAYQADMAAANMSPGHVGYQPIHQALSDADAMVNFQGLAKSDDALNTLEAIKEKVSQWRGLQNPHTVEAADALKQAIGEIRQSTKPGTLSRKVSDSVYNAAKASIVQQAPEYAKAMKGYAEASDKINELERTFSLGEKASQDTTLRKLQSTQRNNVQTNYGQRNALLDDLAQYEPDLPFALAGQSMNTLAPRGLAKYMDFGIGTGVGAGVGANFLNPAFLASIPLASPRIVGEGAYALGTAARFPNALMPVAQYVPDAVKAGYGLNALAPQQNSLQGGIGPRFDENGNRRLGQ